MDIEPLLRANYDKLLELYHANLCTVLDLQETLVEGILPSVMDELQLDQDAMRWAEEWLYDTYTVFQIARRNKFTRSLAMEATRRILVWRLQTMWPASTRLQGTPIAQCLPDDIRDPLGRPILHIKAGSLVGNFAEARVLIVHTFERLREHLRWFNSLDPAAFRPVLQYVVLLDLTGLSMQAANLDLITWTLREVIPRFPGMLAAVFMINYSWTHSGIWSIVKRVLPAAALSRIFFPTPEELLGYFTPALLPEDYGGALPCLTDLDDPLQADRTEYSALRHLNPPTPPSRLPIDFTPPPTSPPRPVSVNTLESIAPTSVLNPYFGYPVDVTRGLPALRHGRRRKRDLIHTLATLFWLRWKTYIKFSFWLLIFTCTLHLWTRRWLLRKPRSAAVLKALFSV